MNDINMGHPHESPLPLPPYSAFIGKLDRAPRPNGMVNGIVFVTCILEVIMTSLRVGFPEIFKGYDMTTLHVFVIVCAILTPLRKSWVPALVMGLCANAQAALFYGIAPSLSDSAQYVLPRLAIPAFTVLGYNLGRRIARDSYYMPLLTAATLGTAANTVLFLVWFTVRIWFGVGPAPRSGDPAYTIDIILKLALYHFPVELLVALIFVLGIGHILRISAVAYSMGPPSRAQSSPAPGPWLASCFVLSPFGEPYDRIYAEVIRPLFKELGMPVQRADEFRCSNVIMEDVRHGIATASIIIADLTGKNPNVFYELGYAHALGKDVLLITQDIRELPFDVRHYRCCGYRAEADESWLELSRWLSGSVLELVPKQVQKGRS
jgi:uncharacterized membrane protein